MRIWGGVITVFCCGAMGITIALSYSLRVKNLRQLIRFIQLLRSEINYARTPLPVIFEKLAGQFKGPLGSFVASLHRKLANNRGDSFQEIWQACLRILKAQGFPPQVLDDLLEYGLSLGVSDAEEQEKHLTFLLIRLEEALTIAAAEKARYTKVWQYLGFCTGLLIVLLLF
ncbi:MAG TPA: hypothetical protein GX528_01240 [Firmicutes bacterium]|nr:hypothetical protein [Bacillota bacterium]